MTVMVQITVPLYLYSFPVFVSTNASIHQCDLPHQNGVNMDILCVSSPNVSPFIDITEDMDIARNPSPMNDAELKSLNVLYFNGWSLKSFVTLIDDQSGTKVCKLSLYQQLIYGDDFDIICICEKWLNSGILDSELLSAYNILRRDRKDRVGDGELLEAKAEEHSCHPTR